MSPSVSVIILSYNQYEFVLDAVESVINQTTDDWELIIIDNGSTDGSKELLLSKYSLNPKIKLVTHAENRKITLNCNQGVSMANGKYISFLYADDYYLPDKFEKEIKCFSSLSSDYGVIHSPAYDYNVLTGEQRIMPCIPASGNILEDLFVRYNEGFINPVSPLVRRECFERYPFYEEIFTEGEGIYFRIAMKYKFHFMPEPTAIMREHGKNMRFAKKQNAVVFEYMMNKLAEHKDFPVQHIHQLRTLEARILASYGWQDIRLGTDAGWARTMFKRAVYIDWRQIYQARTICGWGLSLFPFKFRLWINKMADSMLKRKSIVYMDEYYK